MFGFAEQVLEYVGYNVQPLTQPAMDNKDIYRLPKAELHCHLDGSIRPSTVFQLLQAKGLLPENCYSEHDVVRLSSVEVKQKDLKDYLSCFDFSGKAIRGDKSAIERISYEACVDKFNDGVMYIEFRYAPQLLVGDKSELSIKEVITCVQSGFERASKQLNCTRRDDQPAFIACHLLCGIWNFNDWLDQNIDVALELDPEHNFISGVDLAGDYPHEDDWQNNEQSKLSVAAFRRAKENGLGVTIHAGECKGPDSVDWAISTCGADRVGHGYRVTENKELTDRYLPKTSPENRHCEFCPRSSILTNAQHSWKTHVLNEFSPLTSNISLSTDDPAVQLNTLSTEYRICSERYGWSLAEFKASNMNALDAAFSKHVTAEYKEKFVNCYSMKIKL